MQEKYEIEKYEWNATKFLFYEGKIFWLSPSVMEPKYESFFFEEHIKIKNGDAVLDLGTGTGFLAVLLSPKAKKVIATDISPSAIKCARINIFLNKADDKITVLQGNLFEPAKNEKFDLIVTNPPQMPTPPENKRHWDELSLADDGGTDGRVIVDEILYNVKNFLNPGGRFQMVHLGVIDVKKTMRILKNEGLKCCITAEIRCPLGRLTFERKKYLESIGVKFELDERGVPLQNIRVVTAIKPQ